MPAPVIDCYYYGASPFSFLGHQALQDVARRHGATIAWKPVDLMSIWGQSGAVPPAQRPPVRQRYRIIELQRIAHMRGLSLNLRPAHFPADLTLADCCTIALVEAGRDPASYMDAVYRGVWQDDADLADEAEVARRLEAEGHDAAATVEAARGDAVAAIRAANTREAMERDAVGVPAYVLAGEVFWGQDRIDMIDHALATGRAPFRADA